MFIDSLNGYMHSMGEERHVNLQLHELLTYLNQQGIVTIMIITPAGLIGNLQNPFDVTYLADTVVTFRFFEAEGAVHKAISVIKKRNGNHERTIRELAIDENGITVGPALVNLRGVLTGVPVLVEKKAKSRRANESKK